MDTAVKYSVTYNILSLSLFHATARLLTVAPLCQAAERGFCSGLSPEPQQPSPPPQPPAPGPVSPRPLSVAAALPTVSPLHLPPGAIAAPDTA